MPSCISVVVNSYTNDRFLPQALTSVVDQEFEGDFEIIILSPNQEFKLAEEIRSKAVERGIRVETVQVPYGPIGLGLEQGVRAARGDTIALLDDDDLWEPSKLSRIEIAFGNPAVVYFHNAQTFVDERNHPLSPLNIHRLIRHPASLLPRGRDVSVDSSDPNTLARGREYEVDFQNSSITIRKDVLESHLGSLRRVTKGEDTFLYYCALASRGTLVITTDRLTRYRIHQGGVTATGSMIGSTAGRLQKYVEYASGQQERLELVREEILRSALPQVASSLDSDLAFWSTMRSVATGSATYVDVMTRTRSLLGDTYARPRVRELIAIATGLLSFSLPKAAQIGFSAWRGIW